MLGIGYRQKVFIKRNRSIDLLEKKMNQRIEADKKGQIAIDALALKSEKRRQLIQKRLSQLSERNEQRIAELKNIQENVLNKISSDIKKNQLREKHLKEEYEKLKKQEGKLSEVNRHQRKEAYQQWRVMQNQKWKLEIFARENEQKQRQLIKERNPKPTKKEEKRKDQQAYIPGEKQYRLRNNQSKDAKQAGKKYLEEAKELHR